MNKGDTGEGLVITDIGRKWMHLRCGAGWRRGMRV